MTTAVLVIDVQQGLCVGPHAVFDSAGTVARINTVTRKARAAGAAVVFVLHEEPAESGDLQFGSDAWRLAAGLDVHGADIKLRKTTPDAFLRTELGDVLQAHGVADLVICGMHTEFCVDTTVRRALSLGHSVRLVSDAHTSAGNAAISARQVIAHHNATLVNISSFGPRVKAVTSEELTFDAAACPRERLQYDDEVMVTVRGQLEVGGKLSRDEMNER